MLTQRIMNLLTDKMPSLEPWVMDQFYQATFKDMGEWADETYMLSTYLLTGSLIAFMKTAEVIATLDAASAGVVNRG